MGENIRRNNLVHIVLYLCLLVWSCSPYPLMQPAVFIFPPQNLMQQHFLRPVRTPALKNFLTEIPQNMHDSSSNDEQLPENNGPDPPSRNPYDDMLDTVAIEAMDIPTPSKPIGFQEIMNQQPMGFQEAMGQQTMSFQEVMNQPIHGESTGYHQFQIQPMAVHQYPGGRLSIGQIIMAVPFLPFEVNVPDTISWMYNGISSIFGNIGQRLPLFNPNKPRPYSELNGLRNRLIFTPFRIFQMPAEMANAPASIMNIPVSMTKTAFPVMDDPVSIMNIPVPSMKTQVNQMQSQLVRK